MSWYGPTSWQALLLGAGAVLLLLALERAICGSHRTPEAGRRAWKRVEYAGALFWIGMLAVLATVLLTGHPPGDAP